MANSFSNKTSTAVVVVAIAVAQCLFFYGGSNFYVNVILDSHVWLGYCFWRLGFLQESIVFGAISETVVLEKSIRSESSRGKLLVNRVAEEWENAKNNDTVPEPFAPPFPFAKHVLDLPISPAGIIPGVRASAIESTIQATIAAIIGSRVNSSATDPSLSSRKTHRLLLNGYSLFDRHLLISPKRREGQTDPITDVDVVAVADVCPHIECVAFLNCGAFASQGWRHFQVVSLPEIRKRLHGADPLIFHPSCDPRKLEQDPRNPGPNFGEDALQHESVSRSGVGSRVLSNLSDSDSGSATVPSNPACPFYYRSVKRWKERLRGLQRLQILQQASPSDKLNTGNSASGETQQGIASPAEAIQKAVKETLAELRAKQPLWRISTQLRDARNAVSDTMSPDTYSMNVLLTHEFCLIIPRLQKSISYRVGFVTDRDKAAGQYKVSVTDQDSITFRSRDKVVSIELADSIVDPVPDRDVAPKIYQEVYRDNDRHPGNHNDYQHGKAHDEDGSDRDTEIQLDRDKADDDRDDRKIHFVEGTNGFNGMAFIGIWNSFSDSGFEVLKLLPNMRKLYTRLQGLTDREDEKRWPDLEDDTGD